MSAFDQTVFFKAFAAVGMVETAYYAKSNGERGAFAVGFVKPDVEHYTGSGNRTRQYEIEFEVCASPDMKEGFELQIKGELYTLRADPFIPEDPKSGNDGHFMRAMLSKETT